MKRERSAASGTPSKRPRAYRKTGFHARKGALSRKGLSALDGRSSEARALKAWKADVEADLGGELTTAQRTLLELAAVDVALLGVADAWLRENADGILNRRRKTFVPLVKERTALAAHLAGLLKDLGLKRVPRDVQGLSAYLAERQDGRTPPAGESDP